ncbi:MAG TPA: cation diffusion facilitator family transporter, partial [Chitinophagales bacterium]|nr:cation diffusion facilitator family transporter [Chitinophagales bacterium]
MSVHPAIDTGFRVVLWGIALNVVLCAIKAVTGFVGNSYALVADAIESGGDIMTSIVLYVGLRTAARRPDENHPYGHGKAEPAAAIVVSAVLLASAALIVYNAVHFIQTPHRPPAPYTLIVLALVVVTKEVVFRVMKKASRDAHSMALSGEAQHHRADAVTSLAAFIGISIALWKGPGFESADDWAALLAAVFIAYNAFTIFKPAFSELMDEAQPPGMVEDIKSLAARVPGVSGVEKCFIRKMGFRYYVDIHIEVPGHITVHEGHDIA